MDTRFLQTLVTVAETGSFSQTAKKLHITQSAVSQRIKLLEETFGVQLLDRSYPNVVLTAAGQAVLAKTRELLYKERELVACLSEAKQPCRFALCCTPTFGKTSLGAVLDDFIARHPEINSLDFVFRQPVEALRDLRNAQFDLAVIEHGFGLDFSGLDRYVLTEDELLFVAAPDILPDRAASELNLEELASVRLYLHDDGHSYKALLDEMLHARGADLSTFKSVVMSDDHQFVINQIASGGGLAFLPKTLVSNQLVSGALVALTLGLPSPRRNRSVLFNAGRTRDALLNDLLDSIVRVVGLEGGAVSPVNE